MFIAELQECVVVHQVSLLRGILRELEEGRKWALRIVVSFLTGGGEHGGADLH